MSDENARNTITSGLRLRHTLHGHDDVIFRIAVSADGRLIACGHRDGTIELWELETGGLLRKVKYSDVIFCLAWSPDGRMLASGSKDQHVQLWDVESGSLVRK